MKDYYSGFIPFLPDLKTMSSMLSATTTLTGSLLTSGIGSDFLNGVNLPSYIFKQLMRYYLSKASHVKRKNNHQHVKQATVLTK
jgi:hypothetical protein